MRPLIIRILTRVLEAISPAAEPAEPAPTEPLTSDWTPPDWMQISGRFYLAEDEVLEYAEQPGLPPMVAEQFRQLAEDIRVRRMHHDRSIRWNGSIPYPFANDPCCSHERAALRRLRPHRKAARAAARTALHA